MRWSMLARHGSCAPGHMPIPQLAAAVLACQTHSTDCTTFVLVIHCPGIGLSPNGLWVAVGTESGALSLLDVKRSAYSTLLRSHTAAVHAVALLGQPTTGSTSPGQADEGQQQQQQLQYCTAGEDGTVRVWSGADHQQVLELTAPGEAVNR